MGAQWHSDFLSQPDNGLVHSRPVAPAGRYPSPSAWRGGAIRTDWIFVVKYERRPTGRLFEAVEPVPGM